MLRSCQMLVCLTRRFHRLPFRTCFHKFSNLKGCNGIYSYVLYEITCLGRNCVYSVWKLREGPKRRRNFVRFSAEAEDVSELQGSQNGSGTHPGFYSDGIVVFFFGECSGRSLKLTTSAFSVAT